MVAQISPPDWRSSTQGWRRVRLACRLARCCQRDAASAAHFLFGLEAQTSGQADGPQREAAPARLNLSFRLALQGRRRRRRRRRRLERIPARRWLQNEQPAGVANTLAGRTPLARVIQLIALAMGLRRPRWRALKWIRQPARESASQPASRPAGQATIKGCNLAPQPRAYKSLCAPSPPLGARHRRGQLIGRLWRETRAAGLIPRRRPAANAGRPRLDGQPSERAGGRAQREPCLAL